MEKISLKTSSIYRTSHDIETALAWNAIKKSLHEARRDDLFEYIQSVRVTAKYVTIKTGKPIVNDTLTLLLPTIQENLTKTPGGPRKVKLL